MCPMQIPIHLQPLLQQKLQCDNFKARGDSDGFNQCMQIQKCFQLNVSLPDGSILPAAAKASQCIDVRYSQTKKKIKLIIKAIHQRC